MWGGRFQGGPAEAMFQLSVSTQFDWRLAPEDIAGSIAHASALHRAGLLGDADYEQMEAALRGMLEEVHSGELRPAPTDEDVHGALERILTERVGPVLGGRLRAGRSLNDQIATLIRMYLRREIRALGQDVVEVITALCAQSDAHPRAIMPGRTHMQTAQPVLLDQGTDLGLQVFRVADQVFQRLHGATIPFRGATVSPWTRTTIRRRSAPASPTPPIAAARAA